MKRVFIKNYGIVSAAGVGADATFQSHELGNSCIQYEEANLCGRLCPQGETAVSNLAKEKTYSRSDRVVKLAGVAVHDCLRGQFISDKSNLAIIMGSSRAATNSLETFHNKFLSGSEIPVHTSPSSTSGIIPATIAQSIGAGGQAVFVSSACNSSLTAIGIGASLIQSEMSEQVIAGGAESSLTPFTFKMLEAARVLAKHPSVLFPLRPFHSDRTGMVPGEAAASLLLTSVKSTTNIGEILGYCAVTEPTTLTGVSEEGLGLSKAINGALAKANLKHSDIDLIAAHGSSTPKGDQAEIAAYLSVFEERMPNITCHKWLTGHTLGASNAVSIVIAFEQMRRGLITRPPYLEEDSLGSYFKDYDGEPLQHLLVTGLGFGGQSSAMILLIH